MAGVRPPGAAVGVNAAKGAVPIVALDVPTLERALALVELLGDSCGFYKVGSELFLASGPRAVLELRGRGLEVFLDVKLHDIPNTVRGAARSAARLGARLLTVHASGGRAMMDAAVEGGGDGCGVLGVTVLTSHDGASLSKVWGRRELDVEAEVMRLADDARSVGAHGVVCSGAEVAALRARHGDALRLLVPGLRLEQSSADDQARVVTPAEAARAGASYLVLGRTVTGAADPRAAMASVLRSLEQ